MRWRICLPVVVAVALSGCGQDRVSQGPGAGGETTNGLAVSVVAIDGRPVVGARVVARHSDQIDSVGSIWARSDSMGIANLLLPAGATWTVEASDSENGLLAADSARGSRMTLRLSPWARIEGTILTGAAVAVRVPGLDRTVWSDAKGKWRMDSLPVGVRMFVASTGSNADTARRVLVPGSQPAPVALVPTGRSPEDSRLWSDSVGFWIDRARLGWDTTLGGELTLVRLDSHQVDFAKTAGTDLRFFRSGHRMSHSVARWDAVACSAWVWVQLDTVRPGDSSLMLRYGNPSAKDLSDPAILSEMPSPRSTRAPRLGGLTGIWDSLDGSPFPDRAIAPFSGAFTVSAWIRPSATALDGSCLVCGLDASGRRAWGVVAVASDTTRVRLFVGSDTTASSYPMVRDVWVQVSASWNPATGRAELYMNGYFEQGFDGRAASFETATIRFPQEGWRGSLDGFRLVRGVPGLPSLTWRALTQGPNVSPVRPILR